MGYDRRRWKDRRNNDGRGRARPKLAIVGAILLAIGILFILYFGNLRNYDLMVFGGLGIVPGMVLLFLSLSKRNQVRVGKGMDAVSKAFRDSCQCCKCQNCGRNHNHWVHDDNDTRRRHY